MKDREAMFTEFMTAYRKKEKEDSKNKGEKVKILRIGWHSRKELLGYSIKCTNLIKRK